MTEYEKYIEDLEKKDPQLAKIQRSYFDKFIPIIESCEKLEKLLTDSLDEKQTDIFINYRSTIEFTVLSILMEQMVFGTETGIRIMTSGNG